MRGSLSLATLAFGRILGTSSAALEVVKSVNASANGWDTRNYHFGCSPNGCVPANVLNTSIDDDSRWSCRPSRSLIDACELTFTFDEPQDLFEIRMAMWKGDERNRTVDVWVDGVLFTTVQTSATTLGYETYGLSTTQASTIVLLEAGKEEDVWISITGVQFMKESEVEMFPPAPAPTSDEYVGCFNDVVGDRVLSTVSTYDAMNLADCAVKCGETAEYFYGLQQGNECWCGGCEITERDTNIDFDRHGDGTCNTPCAGDPSSACGGDMSISLYQSTTCLATPAPTPAFLPSGCPIGSTQASLEIIASWENTSTGVELHVIEPGGVEVDGAFFGTELGDVGMWSGAFGPFNTEGGPRTEVYLTLNGLNVADDLVLGDYEIWGEAYYGTVWTITARSGGELLWVKGGVFPEGLSATERFTATVTSYAESDCTINAYRECRPDTFGPDGFPPCTKCPSGVVSSFGAAYCTDPALDTLGVPEEVANAMITDAVGGWAGSGNVDLYESVRTGGTLVVGGEESGTVSVSGNYARYGGVALASSTAVIFYYYTEGSEGDFVRTQGEIDVSSGNFTGTITDIPVGYGSAVFSFVLLDPADAGQEIVESGAAFPIGVINEGCSEALRIKLEWDTDGDMELRVTDPTGVRYSYLTQATDIGYITSNPVGNNVNPDTGVTTSSREYVVFSGVSGDAMLGEYRMFVRSGYSKASSEWTLTATVNGVVAWVENGMFGVLYDDDTFYTDDDGAASRRRLFTDDDPLSSYYSYYSTSSYPQTDTFTVTLDSYDPAGC